MEKVGVIAAAQDEAIASELVSALKSRGLEAPSAEDLRAPGAFDRLAVIWTANTERSSPTLETLRAYAGDRRLVFLRLDARALPAEFANQHQVIDLFGVGALSQRHAFDAAMSALGAPPPKLSPSRELRLRSLLADAQYRPAQRSPQKGYGIGCLAPIAAFMAGLVFLGAQTINEAAQQDSSHNVLGFHPIVWGLMFAAALLGLSAIAFARRHRKASQRQVDELSISDHFVLFFRPFTFDLKSRAYTHSISGPVSSLDERTIVTFEEVLGQTCRRSGLGLRSIGATPDQFGPTAMETSDDLWQREAKRLIAEAHLIVTVPGSSPGSLWEIDQLCKGEPLFKTLWVMLPKHIAGAKANIAGQWAAVQARMAETGLQLPPYSEHGAIVAFRVSGQSGLQHETIGFSFDNLAIIVESMKVAEHIGYDPNALDLVTLHERAWRALEGRNWQHAWDLYDAALKQASRDPEALFGRGVAARKLGLVAQGDGDIEAALRLDAKVALKFRTFGET